MDLDELERLARVATARPLSDTDWDKYVVAFLPDVTLALIARIRTAERPCPWCGHPPMCHTGPEGECVAGPAE